MIVQCIENQLLELKILNYQFPETEDRKEDGNWLNLFLRIESNMGVLASDRSFFAYL